LNADLLGVGPQNLTGHKFDSYFSSANVGGLPSVT
jgi:hypothetical protein